MKDIIKYISLAVIGIFLSGAIIISNRFEVVACNVVYPHYIIADNITGKIYENTAGSSLIYECTNINPERIKAISDFANSHLSERYKKAPSDFHKLIKALNNTEFNENKEIFHKKILKRHPEHYFSPDDIDQISSQIDWTESDKILEEIRSITP